MKIALIGCGYVGDYYARTLPLHPELEVVAVADRDMERAKVFGAFHGFRVATVEEVLRDDAIALVVNLTSTASHFDVSRAALEAGKHVYSEKPLTLDFAEARALVQLAESRGLVLAGAPGTPLGESAQTLWRAIRSGIIGTPRLVYAAIDDGPIHLTDYRIWRSDSGAPWPWRDEFATGCTLEHAGYYVSWLATFFGAATRVTTFASTIVPEKAPEAPPASQTPDFSVACIEYPAGLVARLTCGLMAPRDRSITVMGDGGTLIVDDCWNDGSPVRYIPRAPVPPSKWALLPFVKPPAEPTIPLARELSPQLPIAGGNRMDFARGIAEVAAAVREQRPCRLGAAFTLHVTELMLAMQYPKTMGSPRELESRFEAVLPMEWARD